eukprot:gene6012-4316_t
MLVDAGIVCTTNNRYLSKNINRLRCGTDYVFYRIAQVRPKCIAILIEIYCFAVMLRSLPFRSGKTIELGGDARQLMLEGIDSIASAVGVTLGPKGRNVIIRLPSGEPQITKDGVTVARSIEFHDQFEDIGARLIRQVAGKTNDVAGDGTTTATILASNFFLQGYKSVSTGANPMDLKRGIDAAVELVLESLREQTRPVSDLPMLENVATISANGERNLGRLIAAAVQAVGSEGFITVTSGSTTLTDWTRYDGWSMEKGFTSSNLVTDHELLECRLDNVLVFVTAQPFDSVSAAIRLLEHAKAQGRPLFLVSPSFSEEVMAIITANHTEKIVSCGLLAADELSVEELEDLAVSCNSAVQKVEAVNMVSSVASLLGTAAFASQTLDSTTISGTADVTSRVRFLCNRLERLITEEERERMRQRIAKLKRVYAVIRVGGRSALEILESKDRVTDALNAARNALAEGVVAGGGSALLHASKRIDEFLESAEERDEDWCRGLHIVQDALRLPMYTICENAGEEGAVMVENVLEYTDTSMGYDAQKGQYVNMFDCGIIDPVKVVRSCVVDAASVAGLMITTEAIICDYTGVTPKRENSTSPSNFLLNEPDAAGITLFTARDSLFRIEFNENRNNINNLKEPEKRKDTAPYGDPL